MSARARHRAIAVVFGIFGLAGSALSWRFEQELTIFVALAVVVVAVIVWCAAPEACWTPSPTVVETIALPAHPYRGAGGELRTVVPATSARSIATALLAAAVVSAALGYLIGAVGALVVCWALWTLVLVRHAGKPIADDGAYGPLHDEPVIGKISWKWLLGWPEMLVIPILLAILVVARGIVDYLFPLLLSWPYAAVKRALGRRQSAAIGAAWAAAFLAPLAPLAILLR